jgi:starch synthase
MRETIAHAAATSRVALLPARSPRARRATPHGSALPGVVHLAAECAPYARTGGLGEAVRTLADTQVAAGTAVSIVMPLYGVVRDAATELEPATAPRIVRVGHRDERVQLFGTPPRAGEPRMYFVDHPTFSGRPGLYGDGAEGYPDNAFRFALFQVRPQRFHGRSPRASSARRRCSVVADAGAGLLIPRAGCTRGTEC